MFKMDSKYCSGYHQKRLLSCFPTNKSGKVLATCNSCRTSQAKYNTKRKALQLLHPNLPSKRRDIGPKITTATPSIPQTRPNPPAPIESGLTPRIELEPRLNPAPQEPRLRPILSENGFLSAEQWGWIQSFNTKIAEVKMETCKRCKECWFLMDLKDNVCHDCFRRDKGNKTLFLILRENNIDLRELLVYLLELI
jgi:ssDNA-binding Zn-finger/Zn-ribbon topoisomerase 1